jgi:hypothetical protein
MQAKGWVRPASIGGGGLGIVSYGFVVKLTFSFPISLLKK